MRPIEIGLVLPMGDTFVDGSTTRWVEIRDLAVRAEELGFDTVWTADELLWRPAKGNPQGWWEAVAMTGAVAAATSRVKVGTWILSALHRNPGITAKAVETIDEISDGRPPRVRSRRLHERRARRLAADAGRSRCARPGHRTA